MEEEKRSSNYLKAALLKPVLGTIETPVNSRVQRIQWNYRNHKTCTKMIHKSDDKNMVEDTPKRLVKKRFQAICKHLQLNPKRLNTKLQTRGKASE